MFTVCAQELTSDYVLSLRRTFLNKPSTNSPIPFLFSISVFQRVDETFLLYIFTYIKMNSEQKIVMLLRKCLYLRHGYIDFRTVMKEDTYKI